jgi:hypothetical protein
MLHRQRVQPVSLDAYPRPSAARQCRDGWAQRPKRFVHCQLYGSHACLSCGLVEPFPLLRRPQGWGGGRVKASFTLARAGPLVLLPFFLPLPPAHHPHPHPTPTPTPHTPHPPPHTNTPHLIPHTHTPTPHTPTPHTPHPTGTRMHVHTSTLHLNSQAKTTPGDDLLLVLKPDWAHARSTSQYTTFVRTFRCGRGRHEVGP